MSQGTSTVDLWDPAEAEDFYRVPYERRFSHTYFVLLVGFACNSLLGTSAVSTVLQFVFACLPMWSQARWLGRFDPDPVRRGILVWMYRAGGCVRGATEALAILVIYVIAYEVVLGQGPPDGGVHSLLALLAGIVATVMLGFLATVRAVRHGLPVWVTSGAVRWLINPEELPDKRESMPYNKVVAVVSAAFGLPALVAMCVLLLVLAEAGSGLVSLAAVVLLAGIAGAFVPVIRALLRIAAHRPEQCWPDLLVFEDAPAMDSDQYE